MPPTHPSPPPTKKCTAEVQMAKISQESKREDSSDIKVHLKTSVTEMCGTGTRVGRKQMEQNGKYRKGTANT